MSNPGLFLSVVLTCFSFGALIGRLVEQRRLLKRGLADWDRLWLLIFTAMWLNVLERAAKAGWLPHSPLFTTLVTASDLLIVLPMLFLVAKMYLEAKRSTAQDTRAPKAITKP